MSEALNRHHLPSRQGSILVLRFSRLPLRSFPHCVKRNQRPYLTLSQVNAITTRLPHNGSKTTLIIFFKEKDWDWWSHLQRELLKGICILNKSSQAKEEKGIPSWKRDIYILDKQVLDITLCYSLQAYVQAHASADPISMLVTQGQSRHPQRTKNCKSCILLMNTVQHLLTLLTADTASHNWSEI